MQVVVTEQNWDASGDLFVIGPFVTKEAAGTWIANRADEVRSDYEGEEVSLSLDAEPDGQFVELLDANDDAAWEWQVRELVPVS